MNFDPELIKPYNNFLKNSIQMHLLYSFRYKRQNLNYVVRIITDIKQRIFSKFALQYINPEILKLRFVVFGLALHGSFLHALKKIC